MGASAVEAVPAQPEQTAACDREDHVAGAVVLTVYGKSRTDHRGGDDSGNTRGDMDHIAAGIVHRTGARDARQPARHGAEPAATPEAERVDGVHECDPDRDEEHPSYGAEAGH